MQIKKMTKKELSDALEFMAKSPEKFPSFENFNFDPTDWGSKFKELIEEVERRNGLELEND